MTELVKIFATEASVVSQLPLHVSQRWFLSLEFHKLPQFV